MSAQDGRLLLDEPAPGVARLTISNPAKRGALDHAILGEFTHLLAGLDARCLLITGEGRTFSAGYDLGGLAAAAQPADRMAGGSDDPAPDTDDFAAAAEQLVAHPFTAAIEAIERFPQPTLAALGGHTIGGGLELAISCDLRIAAAGIKLGMPPGKLGLVYSHTGIRKFIDVVGAARTRELFLTARYIDTTAAARWGLVNEVVEFDALQDHALRLATEIAAAAPLAQAGNKRVIEALVRECRRPDAELERELVELRRASFYSDDFREGVAAFAQKRAPDWKGR